MGRVRYRLEGAASSDLRRPWGGNAASFCEQRESGSAGVAGEGMTTPIRVAAGASPFDRQKGGEQNGI
jgi:hypothetical protein